MKPDDSHDELCPEYDFDYSKAIRGKYYRRSLREGANIVVLEPDVAKAFGDSAAVNEALRSLLDSSRSTECPMTRVARRREGRAPANAHVRRVAGECMRVFAKRNAVKPCGLRKRAATEKSVYARRMRSQPTPSEERLWQRLRCRQCLGQRFRRQSVILGWIADFWCPALRLVVEVDGRYHAARQVEDARRDEVMADAGISVLRISSELVATDTEAAVREVRRMVRRLQSRDDRSPT
jgi:very-short-patch-repair endonuclease